MEEIENAVRNSGSICWRIFGYSARQASIVWPLLIRSIQSSITFGSLVLISLLLATQVLSKLGQGSHLRHSYGSLALAHNVGNLTII